MVLPLLPFIFLKNTDTIWKQFCHIFTIYFPHKYWDHSNIFLSHISINLPRKYWNRLNMILSHIYHVLPSKVMSLFGYDSFRYFPFASHESTDIIWIWFSRYCHLLSSKNTENIGKQSCHIFIIYFSHKYWDHSNIFLSHISINLPRKYWNRWDMIVSHIYHVFPSELLASSGYNTVTYFTIDFPHKHCHYLHMILLYICHWFP